MTAAQMMTEASQLFQAQVIIMERAELEAEVARLAKTVRDLKKMGQPSDYIHGLWQTAFDELVSR